MLTALYLVAALSGSPQGLDAPINSTPTVRTEIRRGYLAGEACSSVSAAPESLGPCIDRIRDRVRLNTQDSTAFELGLNLQKSRLANRSLSALASMKRTSAVEQWTQVGQLDALEAQDAINARLSELKITLADAKTAANGASTYDDPLARGRPHPSGSPPKE